MKHSPKILVCEEKATSTTIQLCTHTKLLPDAVAHAVALSVSVSVQMDMILMSLYKCQDKNGKKVLNPGSPGTGSWTNANSSTGHRPPVDCSSEWLLTPRYLWVFILLTAVGPSLESWHESLAYIRIWVQTVQAQALNPLWLLLLLIILESII